MRSSVDFSFRRVPAASNPIEQVHAVAAAVAIRGVCVGQQRHLHHLRGILTLGSIVLLDLLRGLALAGRLALHADVEVIDMLDQAEEVRYHVTDDCQPELN